MHLCFTARVTVECTTGVKNTVQILLSLQAAWMDSGSVWKESVTSSPSVMLGELLPGSRRSGTGPGDRSGSCDGDSPGRDFRRLVRCVWRGC